MSFAPLLLAAAFAAQPVAPAPAAPARPSPQDFRARCGALARSAEARKSFVVDGAGGELFMVKQLKALAAERFWGPDAPRTAKGRPQDPLAAIVDFKAQLDRRGIELLLVPVPAKALVHPELLPGMGEVDEPLGRLDPVESALFAALREKGVAVLDVLPALLARRGGPTDFCKTDHHLNGRGIVLLAQSIADAVKDRPWLPEAQAGAPAWEAAWRETPIQGGLFAIRAHGTEAVSEQVPLRFVTDPKSRRPPAEDRDAPVVLLGDSNVLVFHAGDKDAVSTSPTRIVGAGLPEQLALELKVGVDVVGTMAEGADAPRLSLRNRERAGKGYLARKKLIVWVLFEDAFTQTPDGWRLVPLP